MRPVWLVLLVICGLSVVIVPSTSASCGSVGGVIECDDLPDSVVVSAAETIVSVSAAGGSDTLVVQSTGLITDGVTLGDGADSLLNHGAIGDNGTASTDGVVGGAGDDTIINAADGSITGGLGLIAGTGIDSVINAGTLTGGQFISFGGAAATDGLIEGDSGDTLGNAGTITTPLVGVLCTDTLAGDGCVMTNSTTGLITSSAASYSTAGPPRGVVGTAFRGGAGDDSLLNQGTLDAPHAVVMGGGDDSFANTGSVNGYVGYGGAIAVGVFYTIPLTEAGNDTLVNQGTITGAVNLGAGDDSLYMHGLGTVTSLQARIFGGVYAGDGNDSVYNGNISEIAGIDGGAGDDTLFNTWTVYGAMVGGIGNDSLITLNNGSVWYPGYGAAVNYMGGDDGNDSVLNYGTVNSTLSGGPGADSVVNHAYAQASWLNGDDGSDAVLNAGFVNADLNGGAGDDTVVNFPFAFASFLYGEAGADSIVNAAFALGDARGGEGNDTIVNTASGFGAGARISNLYGDDGHDLVLNAAFVNGVVQGGLGNDTLVNYGGAQATHLDGGDGNDSVFNGGYLVGQLFGGLGDDTVINAAYSYSAGAQLGDGHDQFINGGYLNGSLDCGGGDDTVSLGGFVAGSVACGVGNDLVYIVVGAVPATGSTITGTIDGGGGSDGLGFAFTVNVANQNEADIVSSALAAASPVGGTITIAGVTYAWTNFEILYNLLVFNINEPVTITIPAVRRVNQSDAAAPVAVYCTADAVEIWTVGADGESNAVGSFAFTVPSIDINAGTTVSAAGVNFSAAGDGSFTVSATAPDGKAYVFTGECS